MSFTASRPGFDGQVPGGQVVVTVV